MRATYFLRSMAKASRPRNAPLQKQQHIIRNVCKVAHGTTMPLAFHAGVEHICLFEMPATSGDTQNHSLGGPQPISGARLRTRLHIAQDTLTLLHPQKDSRLRQKLTILPNVH